ncbi:MAG: hypothetical protein LIO65_08720 [Odoribacter sp.]|nr:hypothetical protein [Odoribacter sp.]
MSLIQSLYEKSFSLLRLGEDNVPLYANELSALTREVDSLSAQIYGYSVHTMEEEATRCCALLISFAATYTMNPEKEKRLSHILKRVYKILGSTYADGITRANLALFAYSFNYDEELLKEAGRMIRKWEGRDLNKEELYILELYTLLIES